MALKDKVVQIAYELKDKFTSRVGKVTGSIDDIGNASDKATIKIVKSNKRSILSLRSLANGAKLASVALTALSASAVAAFNSFLNRSDEVAKLSTRLGISTEALSELKHVADLGGVSFQTLTLGFQRMTRRISEAAKGTGEAKGAIEELGLSAETLNKLAPDQQFEVLADAIAKVENPADRVRLAMKLFDSEGVSLVQTMTQGAAGIRAVREEARELGLTIDSDLARSAERVNDSFTRVKGSLQGVFINTAKQVLPFVEKFATAIQQWTSNSENIEGALKGASAALKAFGTVGGVVVGTLSAVGKSLGGIAASLVAVAKGDFREAAGILSATFDGVVDSVKDDAEKITGLWSDAGKEVKKTGEKIQDTSNKTKKVLEQEGQAAAAVGKAHLDRSKALKDSLEEANKALEDDLKSTKDFTKEIKDLVREMQAATGKDGRELGVLDFAESLNNAQQALRAGDFDGAIEGARDTADLLREMKKAGVESDLVLTGLAQQLERFAATASTGQIEAAQQAAEQAQKNLEQAAEKKPVTTPLVLDTTQAEAQLDALIQKAASPVVKQIFISENGRSFSDRPISADEAIRQEARKKGSR